MSSAKLTTMTTMVATLFFAKAAFAGGPAVALVEEVTGAPGVEFMDYVEAGKVIPLKPQDSIVLSYLYSCVRETITGGVITVGKDQSEVQSGKLVRISTVCDAGRMLLSAELASQSAGTLLRNAKGKPDQKTSPPAPQFVLYGLSPMLELRDGGGIVEIARIDQGSEHYTLTVGSQQLLHNAFYDLADAGVALAAGGVYQVTKGGQSLTFKVDPSAKPGKAAIAGRLVRFDRAL